MDAYIVTCQESCGTCREVCYDVQHKYLHGVLYFVAQVVCVREVSCLLKHCLNVVRRHQWTNMLSCRESCGTTGEVCYDVQLNYLHGVLYFVAQVVCYKGGCLHT